MRATMDQHVKTRTYKKKKSGLSSLKKKLNLKKRFTTKLPVHGRHIRGLMSTWESSDIQSVLDQYEMTAILKELSKMADMSRQPAPTLSQDLCSLFKSQSQLTDTILKCKNTEYRAHKAVLQARSTYFKDKFIAQSGLAKCQLDCDDKKNNSSVIEQLAIVVDEVTADDLGKVLEVIYAGSDEDKYASLRVKNQNILQTTLESAQKENFQSFNKTVLNCDGTVIRRSNQRLRSKQRFSMDERILSSLAQQKEVGSKSSNCFSMPLDHHGNDDHILKTTSANVKHVPHRLKHDMSILLEQAEYCGDMKLVFSKPRQHEQNGTKWTPQQYYMDNCHGNMYQAWLTRGIRCNYFSYRDRLEPVLCHKAILAARSPFMRRLIEKQEKKSSHQANQIVTIDIDSGVIPPRYINVVLFAMYTDKIDISRTTHGNREGILPHGVGNSILQMRDLIELHHVANFLEFPALAHGCEDLIIRNLEPSNLLQVLHWTTLPHGSQWVKRQLFSYMREKFTELTTTNVLYELSEADIIEVLQSDFVNASELDILKSVLRWGEYELLRRIEKREPRLLSQVPYSMYRNKTASVRRRELVSLRREELHECTAPVLKCVRTQHLLPYNPDVLVSAIKRGVISRPPAHLLECFNEQDGNCRSWIRQKAGPCYVPPRLFMPYIEEVKNILNERLAQESSGVSLRSVQRFSQDNSNTPIRFSMVPDMVYQASDNPSTTQSSKTKKYVQTTKYIDGVYKVPKPSQIIKMKQREVVIGSLPCIRTLFMRHRTCNHPKQIHDAASDYNEYNCNRCIGKSLIHKIVLRENDFPDSAVGLLEHTDKYYSQQEIKAIKRKNVSKSINQNDEKSNEVITDDISDELSTEIKELNIAMQQIEEICNSSPMVYLRSKSQDSNAMFQAHTDGEIDGNSSDECYDNYNPSFKLKKKVPGKKLPVRGNDKRILTLPPEEDISTDDDLDQLELFRDRLSARRSSSGTNVSFHSIPDVAAPANWRNSLYEEISSTSDSSSDENEYTNGYIRPLNNNIFISRNHPPSYNLSHNPSHFASGLFDTTSSRNSVNECGKYFFSTPEKQENVPSTSSESKSNKQTTPLLPLKPSSSKQPIRLDSASTGCPWIHRGNASSTSNHKSSNDCLQESAF